jgi:tetrachlorobenzoquinone reductase
MTSPIRMRLMGIRHAAEGIHEFEFRPSDGTALPVFEAGAHVDVHLPNGLLRQYSLINAAGESHRYVIAVKRDPASRGGSACMHEQLRVGASLLVAPPRNNFPVREDAPHSVFFAGGIGITPIVSMVGRLRKLGRPWELHYSVRRRNEAAFLSEIGDGLRLHVDEEAGGRLLDIAALVAAAPKQAHLYCCGPAPMLQAYEAATAGRPADHVHLERFSAAAPVVDGDAFVVELARSGRQVTVAPGESILDALRDAGLDVQSSCEQGVCGTCETRVLAGVPDHRDMFLSNSEKAANDRMLICCSGSKDARLVLDL